MKRVIVLIAPLLLAAILVACTRADPYETGKALGARHAEAAKAHTLTVDQMVKDMDDARAPFSSKGDKERFSDGYKEGVRPARQEIVALMMEEAGSKLGEALGDAMEGLGEGLGRAVSGFMKGVKSSDGEGAGSDDEGAEAKGPTVDKEALKNMGRGLGKVVKGLAEGAEAVADGVQEELTKPSQPAAEPAEPAEAEAK